MNKKTKISIIAASLLIVLGLILGFISLLLNDFDFKTLDTSTYNTNEYIIEEQFDNIEIVSDTAVINFIYTTNSSCKVVCYESNKEYHNVSLVNNTLKIHVNDEHKWHDYISIGFDNPTVTIYLPYSYYNNLNINTDTGDINIPKEFSFNNINIKASTADINIEGNCNINLNIDVSTGDITVSNNYTNSININTSTGDVNLINSDANYIYINTSTGDVFGTLLTTKLFDCTTDTGDINIPKESYGNICKINTSTGDITISVLN